MTVKVSSLSETIIKDNLSVKRGSATIEAKRSHNFQNPQKAIRGAIKEKTIEMIVGVEKGNKISIRT